MKFSLIICTYQRPEALLKLLKSVQLQSLYPDQILIVDGSTDLETQINVERNTFKNLEYFLVNAENRGLTRQRNYGVSKVSDDKEVVCFLDDDIVLTPEYFKNLIGTYVELPDAIGVGGYILNEVDWKRAESTRVKIHIYEYECDGWFRRLGSRNELRKRFGLLSDKPPGFMPEFSNGLSIGFLPPSGKVYPVEFFMGGVASYKKKLFNQISFSSYFEGYGLYEDMDFCLRASQIGQLYVNTGAGLYHYHEISGRPNKYAYGKMVIRNGWYVWRIKYPSPNLKARLKWHGIACLLTFIRFGNVITTRDKKEAFTESFGRIIGWWSLFFNTPKLIR